MAGLPWAPTPLLRAQWLLLAVLFACGAGQEDYMARLDPSLRIWTREVRVSEEALLYLQLHRGQLTAALEPGGAPLDLSPEEQRQLLGAFPRDALAPEALEAPLAPEAWAAKLRLHSAGLRIDARCAVNGENHLERTILDIFGQLKSPPFGAVLTLGGLYGGRDGEGEFAPDDPAVELLLEMQRLSVRDLRALCWGCEVDQVASLTRAQSLQNVMKVLPFPAAALRSAAPLLNVPQGFEGEVDLLRLDSLALGASCQVLGSLLRAGVRPRMVAMFVLSQVPPPFKFVPLGADEERHPPALLACSLSAAAEVVAPYGLSLLRLTGPYALFVQRGEWHEDLPIDDLDCYRSASVWGMKDIPLPFVREWLFADIDQALPNLWRNFTALYAAVGQPDAPFTLAV